MGEKTENVLLQEDTQHVSHSYSLPKAALSQLTVSFSRRQAPQTL